MVSLENCECTLFRRICAKPLRPQKIRYKVVAVFKYSFGRLVGILPVNLQVNDMSQGLKEIVDDLKAEQLLLQQLIYRNHNQHSSSQLFSYLKNTARVLKLITPERIHAAAGRCELALRSSGQAKLSQTDISEIADTHVLLFAVVNMLGDAMNFTLKSSDLVRILLGKKLFLPLYTMLLAISSRLFCCLAELHKHFYVQCNALTSQLQVCALKSYL